MSLKESCDVEIQRVADGLRMEYEVRDENDAIRRQRLEHMRRPQGRGPQGGQEEEQEDGQEEEQEEGHEEGQ